MFWKNTDTGYSFAGKFLHWVLAIFIISQIFLGLYLQYAKIGVADLYLYGWHKAFGMMAFSLIILRIFWRLSSAVPKPLGAQNLQAKLAISLHRLLYVLMVVIPLSGWIASSASGFPMSFFNWFPLPAIAPVSEPIETVFFAIHDMAGKLLILVLALHIAGALQRQLIKQDATLRRMWF